MNAPFPGQVVVPPGELSPEALRGVVEEFVTRDGTDYGETWVPLEEKVAQVMGLLRRGEAVLLFDPETGRTQIAEPPR